MFKSFCSRFLNPANILTIGLVVVMVLLAVQSFANKPTLTSQQTLEFRVIHRQADKLYVWSQDGIRVVADNYTLQVGREYRADAVSRSYDLEESYDKYLYTLGLVGELENLQILEVNQDCDIFCQSLSKIYDFKRWIFNRFDKVFCKQNFDFYQQVYPDYDCSDNVALSQGLLIGNTEGFDTKTRDLLKKYGLTHLVAVSGFQVVLVASLIENFLQKAYLNRIWRLGLAVIGILGLVVMVGPQPPVLRSGFSVVLSQLVLLFVGRKLATWRALVYSGIIMLVINPLYIFNISFQLSFLASLGLVVSLDADNWNLNLVSKSILSELQGVIATFLFTLPVIIQLQTGVSVVGILSNILILPIIPWLSALNLIGLIPVLGDWFLWLAGLVQTFGFGLLGYLEPWIPATDFPELTSMEIGLYYFWLLLIWLPIKFLAWYKNSKLVNS